MTHVPEGTPADEYERRLADRRRRGRALVRGLSSASAAGQVLAVLSLVLVFWLRPGGGTVLGGVIGSGVAFGFAAAGVAAACAAATSLRFWSALGPARATLGLLAWAVVVAEFLVAVYAIAAR